MGVVSKRVLSKDRGITIMEVMCRGKDGVLVRNIVRTGMTRQRQRQQYISVNGLWLPLGIPGPNTVPVIPPCIWQTHASQAYVDARAVLKQGQDTWKGIGGFAGLGGFAGGSASGFTYRFHDDAQRDALIRDHFSDSLYPLYTHLPLEVMKADVWRYAVVYLYGGVYADMDTVCIRDPSVLVNSPSWMVVAPEPFDTPYFCQWIFAAAPRSPVLGAVLAMMTQRLREAGGVTAKSFAKDPHLIHRLTGPAMFTDAIRAYWGKRGLPVLDRVEQYGRYPSHMLRVLPTRFHKTTVKHASLGSTTSDGWQTQRDHLVATGGGRVPKRR